MTDLAVTQFAGGAAGTPVTAASEPFFSSVNGTVTYAEVDAGRMGARPNPAGAGEMFRASLDGRTKYGFRWKVKFESVGAATAYYLSMVLRNGTTVRSDVGLRNAVGARHAAFRNSFVYVGEATGNPMQAGEIWSFETVVDGLQQTVRAWEADVDFDAELPAPIYEWAATLAVAPDNAFFGNSSNTTVSTIMFDIRFTDGESAPPPAPGALTFLSSIWADQSQVVLVGKVADAVEVQVDVGAQSVTVAPDAAGYFRAGLAGLAADTAHAWDVRVDGVSRRTGSVTTLPADADGLTFLWGSCFDTYTSQFFALADARAPRFIVGLGDHGYQYITGGPNGNTSPTDAATCRLHREPVLAAAAPQGLFTKYPYSYTFSDCDGGGANADGTTGGLATGAVQAAYRQQFAHPALPLAGSGARSWVVGRVRFVQTDETAAASAKDAPLNDPAKTKLGAEQKAWLKAQIDAAAAANQAVVWFGDGPWIRPSATGGNEWTSYAAERQELADYIAASGVKIVRLHGDTHTLFADDGTNNPYGGFPTASAAPMHTTANPYGGPVTNGKWPTTHTNSSRQYGVGSISDDGETLALTIRGYSSTNSEPAEVERFAMTVDLTPGAAPTGWRFIEWDGTTETALTPVEVTDVEVVLDVLEQA